MSKWQREITRQRLRAMRITRNLNRDLLVNGPTTGNPLNNPLKKKLVLLHSNDMHGDFLADVIDSGLVGGVSMLSGYLDKVRHEEQTLSTPSRAICSAGRS